VKELEIDWNGLHSAFQMNMPEVRCFLCLEDGKVLKLSPGDTMLPVASSDPSRFALIETVPSRIQYQWVDDFVKTIETSDAKARIEAAINGKGAFRRFKDILMTMPDERRRWFEFRDQMIRKRIIDWVLEHGIKASNPIPWIENTPVTAANLPIAAVEADPELDTLRHFLDNWVQQQGCSELTPTMLDSLVKDLGQKFRIKSLD
jgi:hypothetical protein